MKDDDVLGMYLRDINRIPLLSREEETDLAVKAAAGDKAAKDKIVRANLRFVVNIAKKYQNHGLQSGCARQIPAAYRRRRPVRRRLYCPRNAYN